eukprot:210426-Pyramimonas_sp.AAC.1
MKRCVPLVALLGWSLVVSCDGLEVSWAVWKPSGAFWTDRSAIRGPLGPSEQPLGLLSTRFFTISRLNPCAWPEI